MKSLNKKQYYLDLFGLLSVGMISLGYVVFVRKLAERHIQLPFLNFPVFIGEIFLFICLLLFLAKYWNHLPKFTKWHYVIICYFIFVVIKALYGYYRWGKEPLAFRHAALLYYPVFALFGYAFFRKEFFSKRNCLILSLIIFALLLVKHGQYWLLTLVLLAAILIRPHLDRRVKAILFLFLFAIVPYREFFQTSRMMIVANFFTGLYLAASIPMIFRIDRRFKLVLIAFISAIIVLGLFKFADHGAIKSIVAFKKMREVIKSCDASIKAGMDDFVMEKRSVKLYNPNRPAKNVRTPAEEQKRAQLKQMVIVQVKEKISDLSSGPADKKTQEITLEVEKEIKSVLDDQLEGKSKEQLLTHAGGQSEAMGAEKNAIRQELFHKVSHEIRKIQAEEITGAQKKPDMATIDDVKTEVQIALLKELKDKSAAPPKGLTWGENNNAVFRLLIWRDMLADLAKEKPLLGFDFGKPFRSVSLEILNWGTGDWARDGWIEPHNSYLHIFYRAGLIGLTLILSLFFLLFKMMKDFISTRSFTGICLCGILINWFVAANFLVIFELPYTAIPIWSIFGLTLAYYHETQVKNSPGPLS